MTAEDFADAAKQLDRMPDEDFSRYGLSKQDVTALGTKFEVWPRTPQSASRELAASELPDPGPAREHHSTPIPDDPELGQRL